MDQQLYQKTPRGTLLKPHLESKMLVRVTGIANNIGLEGKIGVVLEGHRWKSGGQSCSLIDVLIDGSVRTIASNYLEEIARV